MPSPARSAYSGAQAARLRAPRNAEYDVFAGITARLRRHAGPEPDFPALARALDDNRRLWTALIADVSDDDNALPRELRARIAFLGRFTLAHTRQVLAGKAEPDVLVEINTAVMRGLAGEEGAG